MQLILDTEPTIGIAKTMSAVEEVQSSDVVQKLCQVNNDIADVPKNGKDIANNDEEKIENANNGNNIDNNTLVLEITVKKGNGDKGDAVTENGEVSSVTQNEEVSAVTENEKVSTVTDNKRVPDVTENNEITTNGITDTSNEIIDAEEPAEVLNTEAIIKDNVVNANPSSSNGIDSNDDKKKDGDDSSQNMETDKTQIEERLQEQEKTEVDAVMEEKMDDVSNSLEDNLHKDDLIKNESENDADTKEEHSSTESIAANVVDEVPKDVKTETLKDDTCIADSTSNIIEQDDITEKSSKVDAVDAVKPIDTEKEPELPIETDHSVTNVKEQESELSIKKDEALSNIKEHSNEEEKMDTSDKEENPSVDVDSVTKSSEDKDVEMTEIVEDITKEEEVLKEDKVTEETTAKTETIMEVDDVEVISADEETIETNDETTTAKDGDNVVPKPVCEDNNVIEIMDDPEKTVKKPEVPVKESTKEITKDVDNSKKAEVIDEDDIKIVEENKTEIAKEPSPEKTVPPKVSKLSNTLNILSDDEDELPTPTVPSLPQSPKESQKETTETKKSSKLCIDIDDDDDILFIDEKESASEEKSEPATDNVELEKDQVTEIKDSNVKDNKEDLTKEKDKINENKINDLDSIKTDDVDTPKINEKEQIKDDAPVKKEVKKPLLPLDFLKSAKKNLADMTRDELEEFCILKLVESIVDRSSLNDIKTKMKAVENNIEEYKKKATILTKQNRDLQVVLKSVQEEMKKRPTSAIAPLKITRSVGMQVLMTDKSKVKPSPIPAPNNNNRRMVKKILATQKPPPANSPNIPVPRLVPASPAKTPTSSPVTAKQTTPNGLKNPSPVPKQPEKRPVTRQSSMTVDLTDDEPPSKIHKSMPIPPVRLVPSQNLMAPRASPTSSNPRKVYIPINTPSQQIRPVVYKAPTAGPRPRLPSAVPKLPQSTTVRMNKMPVNRHPAPLPEVSKQCQSPTWKALPPAPDLKLSKVENGIVISWKIEGYREDSYEKIASYQLYAYQETTLPPSTSLWKKIGDVKALPLPMACTLTQFMAGFKYYFAVRAVDVKSRLGPFSLPGSILLLNKM